MRGFSTATTIWRHGVKLAWGLALASALAGATSAAENAPAATDEGPRFQAPLGPEHESAPASPERAPATGTAPIVRERLEKLGGSEPVRQFLRLGERLRNEETRDEALVLTGSALAVLVGLPLLVFVVFPLLRGRGDLTVTLSYPDELDGSFRVRAVKRRPKKSGRGTRRGPADPGADRAATRNDHPMVTRETRFQRIQARSWWVMVEGILTDPDSDEVLESRWAQERVRVRRGMTVRLSFDLQPELCPVDLKILWDKRPVREAQVARHGIPTSVRRAHGGTLRLKLERGAHTLVVGSADRVAERAVDVASYRSTWSVVDLGGTDNLLFKGCPPAVEPYLQGDYAGAARALEREGQAKVAHVLLGRLDEEQGRTASAAEHYEKADKLIEAAELWASLSEFERSATLFDRGGALVPAAEMYSAAGESAAAGGAYERAQEWAQAAACYEQAGEVAHWIGALERLGSYFRAAELSIERSDWTRAVRNLQHVAPGDSRYAEACEIQARCYDELGDPELAARKLEERVRSAGPEGAPVDVQVRLAEVLERSGEHERALQLYEAVRERDASQPLHTVIESLRKKVSRDHNATVAHDPSVGRAFATPGFRRYEILEEIGRGGMGVVYKARDQRLGRTVALKRLPENLRDHPKAVGLFLREAQAAAALNHPNIVTLFDADEEDGIFFLTMELLEGQNLYTLLRRAGHIKPRDVARLGIQTCAGLGYAHEQRIVHRDIKTANLFFTQGRVLKIMDFGLAKMIEEVRRAVTVVAGTPYYMAPEQSAGEQVDHRADLYALGVTLFELATGTLPFEEGDVALQHRDSPRVDPRSRQEDVPDALAGIILDLMARDPQERPESAGDIATRLQEILVRR
jgi:tRNA A-37 threonylcarbamoyl transferase component Bud32